MRLKASIIRDNTLWKTHVTKKYVEEIAYQVMNYFPNFCNKKIEISVLLSSDAMLKELNSKRRQINEPTDVLSFPDIQLDWRNILKFNPTDKVIYLGDIAFSFDSISQFAIQNNVVFKDHFAHLLIHSILHLLGYEHDTEEGFEAMHNLEQKILANFNIFI